jgi:cation diffusion facilitator family transporter
MLQFAGLCLAVDALLAALKIAVGLISGSHAVLASALYSINDLLSSIAISVGLKVGHRPASEDHPYGYGKAEFIAIGMVSLAIAIGVFLMFFFLVVDIVKGTKGPPHLIALVPAVISAVVCWSLSRKGHALAGKHNSPALTTSAEHHRADAIGSLAAIVGVAGALAGFHSLDRIIALLETVHLIALSGTLLGKSINGLMDLAIPEDDAVAVEDACAKLDGVRKVAHVRSRRSGGETWVDVALVVSQGLTVGQAHDVCRRAEAAVRSVLGPTSVPQVRFQAGILADDLLAPGGAQHV